MKLTIAVLALLSILAPAEAKKTPKSKNAAAFKAHKAPKVKAHKAAKVKSHRLN